MSRPPRVLLIAGSLRTPSYTHGLVTAVGEAVARYGAEPVTWDLRSAPLPMSDPRYHHAREPYPDPAVRRLRAAAEAADAFVLGSPIYHNSYSGLLKNALDLLEIAQVGGKAVAVVSHGGGRSRQAVDHLRLVARGLAAWTVPAQVCTEREDFAAGGGGSDGEPATPDPVVRDAAILARVNRVAAELTAMARLLPHVQRALSP